MSFRVGPRSREPGLRLAQCRCSLCQRQKLILRRRDRGSTRVTDRSAAREPPRRPGPSDRRTVRY
eukprot:754853-Hanusia_phi.AAC.1